MSHAPAAPTPARAARSADRGSPGRHRPHRLTAAPAHAAPQDVRVLTVNVDFGNSAAKVKQDFRRYAPKADIILMQEAKKVTLRRLLGNQWVVRQRTSDPGRRNSAIVVRRSILRDQDGVTGFALTKGTEGGQDACQMETRWIAHAVVHLANGGAVRVASLHLPKKACDQTNPAFYSEMATQVVELSDRYPRRLLLGGDWNKVVRSDPRDISGRSNERIVPRAPRGDIDGFYLRARLPQVGRAQQLARPNTHPRNHPDGHRPVRVVVSVPASW